MQPDNSVAQERTEWRDREVSRRHRDWGYDCPAADIDFLEYDRGRAVALCEWKLGKDWEENDAATQAYNANDWSLKAMRDLADRASVPLFVIVRQKDMAWFKIYPESKLARAAFDNSGVGVSMYKAESEAEFVAFLYWLRKREVPDHIWNKIESTPFVARKPIDELRAHWNRAISGHTWERITPTERIHFVCDILGITRRSIP
jgi:hypothetical protein